MFSIWIRTALWLVQLIWRAVETLKMLVFHYKTFFQSLLLRNCLKSIEREWLVITCVVAFILNLVFRGLASYCALFSFWMSLLAGNPLKRDIAVRAEPNLYTIFDGTKNFGELVQFVEIVRFITILKTEFNWSSRVNAAIFIFIESLKTHSSSFKKGNHVRDSSWKCDLDYSIDFYDFNSPFSP